MATTASPSPTNGHTTNPPKPQKPLTSSIPQSSDPYLSALHSLNTNGYVVLPATLFPSFSLPKLRAASAHITHLARTGQWPYIRTLPKQFPPWPSGPGAHKAGIWGVQHLMHPRNPERLTFAESYFDGELLRYVAALVNGSAGALGDKKEEGEEDDLVMELYNLLVRPDVDFALRWHRDDIPATATPEEELERLNKPGWHAQWNLPLYDDASLIVVPGSHTRARTEAERNADPYEPNMPNQKIVELKAGEVVFYNNNILHRGVYTNGKERMTLHGSVGSRRAGTARARNVLQHGVGEWAGTEGFEGLQDRETRERAEVMRKRLCELGGRSGDVGFFAKDE